MSLEKLNSIVCRLFFFGAFIILGVTVLKKILNTFGYSILLEIYDPARLLTWSVILLVFVIALLLREISGCGGNRFWGSRSFY